MDCTSENCRKEFMALRNNIRRQVAKAPINEKEEVIIDCYNDVCLNAVKNDVVAQDFLSYIFKKGFENVIRVNYEKSMQWQILAGANGNQFAIDKLSIFLNYALTEIMNADDFGYILARNELNDSNLMYIIGKLICEAIIDELQISPEKLVKAELRHMEFNSKVMRVFDNSRNFAIPKVLKFLRS